MQFNVVFIVAALLASASPTMSVTITAFAGPDCTGTVTGVDTVSAPNCVFFTNGGSMKSFSYSGVPHQINFFHSGGSNLLCDGIPFLVLGGGSGCGTAPDGFNIKSVTFN